MPVSMLCPYGSMCTKHAVLSATAEQAANISEMKHNLS